MGFGPGLALLYTLILHSSANLMLGSEFHEGHTAAKPKHNFGDGPEPEQRQRKFPECVSTYIHIYIYICYIYSFRRFFYTM